jgi:LPS O-antigen subunit length determinant protein (WzzB/FepE family)
MDLSELPEAIQVPSGWNLRELIEPWWSSKLWIIDFYVTSHNFTLRSSDPEPISLVSGENWAVLIQLSWARIENWNFLSGIENTLRVLSSEPDNNREPSDEKFTLLTGAECLLII